MRRFPLSPLVPLGLVAIVFACGGAPDAAEPGVSPPPSEDASSPPAAVDAATVPTSPVPNGTDAAPPPVDASPDAPPPPPKEIGEPCVAARECISKHCAPNGTCQLLAPSCTGAPGTTSCGLDGEDDNCCTSLPVPAGSYERNNNPARPATVSAFRLDKYEITVGRLRRFFEAKNGNLRASPPAPGSGAHPKIPGSGWRSSFDVRLPGSWTEIRDRLGAAGCSAGGDNDDGGAATFTAVPGAFESLPITCADWYTLFAFCIWDGGRLPTDAEWGYAAQGGSEQRTFAFTNVKGVSTSEPLLWGVHDGVVAAALYDPAVDAYKYSVGTPFRIINPVTGKVDDGPSHIARVGQKTGRGRWGQADLTGNVLEYLLDETTIPDGDCVDCARIDWPDPPQNQVGWYPPQWWIEVEQPDGTMKRQGVDGQRSLRGGSWDPTHPPWTWFYYGFDISRTYYAAGARCAR